VRWWWKISELYNNPMKFDVITANDCLNQMTDQVLKSYLNIFGSKCHDDTLVLIQDQGTYIFRDDNKLKRLLMLSQAAAALLIIENSAASGAPIKARNH